MGMVLPKGDTSPMKNCTCGAVIPPNAAFCEKCGRAARPLCGLCNTVFPEGANFCGSCGAPKGFTRPTQCPNCNIRLVGVGNFCTGCGQLLFKFCGTCGNRQMSGWLHCPVCNRPASSQDDIAAQFEGQIPPTAVPAVGGTSSSDLAEILNQEGATAFERGQFDDAEQLFSRAAQLDPEEPLYRVNLAAVLGETGRDQEAEAALQEALAVDPDDPATLLAAGVFASDRDRREEAIRHWQRILEVAPDSEEAEEARQNLEEIGAA